jgi:ribosomal protein S4
VTRKDVVVKNNPVAVKMLEERLDTLPVVRKGGKHSVESATAMIKRTGGLVQGKKIFHPTAGIKVLGAMDYLVHHCGFFVSKGA